MGGNLSTPWRQTNGHRRYKEILLNFKPQSKECQHVRILLCGPAGAGKSCFINSVDSALRGKVTGRVQEDATMGQSFTKKYRTFNFREDDEESYLNFVISDVMGTEGDDSAGIYVEDIILAMKGHVKDGYQFKPGRKLSAECDGYNAAPTLSDKVHVVVYVLPADNLTIMSDEVLDKISNVRSAARDLEIPQLAILTKIDTCFGRFDGGIKDVHRKEHLRRKVATVAAKLGVPEKFVLLVKNYHNEITTNADVDELILMALEQIVSYGNDFLGDYEKHSPTPREAPAEL